MKQKSGFLAFLLSAIILWVLSQFDWIPFIDITVTGRVWVTILIVAIVLGIINFVLVAVVKRLFKKGSSLFILVVTLAVDALALILTSHLVNNFDVGGWVSAILTAAILAVVCTAAGLVKD